MLKVTCNIIAKFFRSVSQEVYALYDSDWAYLMLSLCFCFRHSSLSRLYCDICDTYDQHFTEDCPVQDSCSSSSHSQNSSLYATINNADNCSKWCEVCLSESCCFCLLIAPNSELSCGNILWMFLYAFRQQTLDSWLHCWWKWLDATFKLTFDPWSLHITVLIILMKSTKLYSWDTFN